MIKQYSESQIRLLKQLQTTDKVLRSELDEHDVSILEKEKLVWSYYKGDNPNRFRYTSITEEGEIYLTTKEVDDQRYAEPVKISKLSLLVAIIAAIISVIALLKSFGAF